MRLHCDKIPCGPVCFFYPSAEFVKLRVLRLYLKWPDGYAAGRLRLLWASYLYHFCSCWGGGSEANETVERGRFYEVGFWKGKALSILLT